MKKGSILVSLIVILTSLLFFGIAVSSAVLSLTIKTERAKQNIVALNLAEAGINKAVRMLNQPGGNSYTGELESSLGEGFFDVTVTNDCGINCKQILATGYTPSKVKPLGKKTIRVKVKDKPSSTGVAFNYGVQAGDLGITMSNNAKIYGNVYAKGTLQGANGALVTGDVIMSGGLGKIVNTTINGYAKANTIVDSRVGKDAYYTTLINTVVTGTKYPGSPDPINHDLPITDSNVAEWEQAAAANGTYEGDYILNDEVGFLGPKKINGDLVVTNGATLNVTGTLWVTGNINFSTNAIVKLSPGYGSSGGLIVADNPNDQYNYGKITVANNVSITGSGEANSHIMLLSTKRGMTVANPAIVAGNNSDSVIYYTTVGMLEVSNNAHLKAMTGGGLHLSNNAEIIYDTGLASTEFSGGPGGKWKVQDWQIIY